MSQLPDIASNLISKYSVSVDGVEGVVITHIKEKVTVLMFEEKFELTVQGIQAINKAVGIFNKGIPKPQISVLGEGFTATKEAREYGASEEAHANIVKSAIVYDSLAHKIMGNFFLRVQGPARPTKMFTTLKDALDWINSGD